MADAPLTYSIDACDEAFVRDFCPYKGSPDPHIVWRAAWNSAMAAAPSPPVAAAPATPVAPDDWWISEVTDRLVSLSALMKRADSMPVMHEWQWLNSLRNRAAAQPQPQPAQPLTGARQDAVVQALKDAIGVISSINGGHANKVMKNGEAVYWQRKEWIDWARLEVMPTIEAALASITAPSTPTPEVAP